MIDVFIYYQEAVVSLPIFMECYTGILLIMFLYILTKLFGNLPVIDINSHTGKTLG